jgi:hypothetical protein
MNDALIIGAVSTGYAVGAAKLPAPFAAVQ